MEIIIAIIATAIIPLSGILAWVYVRLQQHKIQYGNPKEIEEKVRSLAAELGIKAADIIHPARVALTGRAGAPGIFEVISLIGKKRVIERLGNIEKVLE